uniref:ATP synthase FO subunit 8 n=1 Tax=Microgaster sp. SNS-2016 TaxID=1911510 RepID=A0A6F8AT01_9HYME|nr:ATP synthase FO subunit 8 [Microgaster sp. SNS-2016]
MIPQMSSMDWVILLFYFFFIYFIFFVNLYFMMKINLNFKKLSLNFFKYLNKWY